MRPGRTPPVTLNLTRRALAHRLAGAAAVIGIGDSAVARQAVNPAPVLDPELRDAALRGLALAGYRGDPVTAAAANAALDRLAATDPEAALLGRIYQILDVRPARYWPEDVPEAAAADLAVLHAAIRACQPVAFGYTDLSGNETTRRVLPLVLVHPPQGVKLLAWCEERAGFRQFFVRAMTALTPQPGDFGADRMALLQGLLDKETGRV
ncbi:WYL domain-containing protein [Paracoccus pacificus]|uniref:WYL domain-containing protein n=1 Tax=Paracoccus pacificus TaxID=1463598 RepID=A0ABW4R5M5_9RHOB